MENEVNQEERMAAAGYITARAAATLMGVHFATVHRYLDDNKLRGTKAGDRHYVELMSIVEYLGPVASKALGITP